MQNLTNEDRRFRYYEGVCSSGDFIKEIAKVLSLGVRDEGVDSDTGKVINKTILISKNWDIVYPRYKGPNLKGGKISADNLAKDYDYYVKQLGSEDFEKKILNQVDQITNNVVLRTRTTEKEEGKIDDLTVSEESEVASRITYVQFYKPTYLANPEEYPLDAELRGLTPQLITKEMYREARKSTASVIYDFTQLEKEVKNPAHEGLVTSSIETEYVDSMSNPYTREELFGQGDKSGILNGLVDIFGVQELEQIPFTIPGNRNPTSYLDIDKVYLNSIKNNDLVLYNFIMDICNLKATFTEEDYDFITVLHMQVTFSTFNGVEGFVVSLTYEKKVEIFTIHAKTAGVPNVLDLESEYGHIATEEVHPELYSEGRYVPLPLDYFGDLLPNVVNFAKDIKFSLDKVQSDDILYGTIVLRYKYDKNFDYVDLKSLKITDSTTLLNNHYCLIRMFDNPAIDYSGPNPNIVDNEGNITTLNSHASPWSKLSWYRDFEEVMMDHIDEDVSVTSITDGTLLVPLETAGLNADTKLSYWINCNNDRFSLIVMGNPALDYEEDRHLTSSCYVGRIDSFEGSINDVSGNFALYTSSSTTPCKTIVETNDNQYHIDRNYTDDKFKDAVTYEDGQFFEDYKTHCKKIGGELNFTEYVDAAFPNLNAYYVTLTGNKFFNENEMPRYAIFDSEGNPVNLTGNIQAPSYYRTVAYRKYLYGSSDSRSNQLALYIPRIDGITSNDGYKIYFNFGYYEEKFVITSGITRDIFGNVINIQTIDEFGKNTSDGTTSVSMFHTRSKAFFQKHHFLFATTEEYMSKVMYGKSSYTGEYYADRIKITHGNDGPRGTLSDVLVIDSSSLYPKDELVINKDFEKDPKEMEETFVYFPVTAPFSPLSDGPNARYGLALKKEEREPNYEDFGKIVAIGKNQLKTIMGNCTTVIDDITLPSVTKNGTKIYWEIKENSNWIELPDWETGTGGETISFVNALNDEISYYGKYIKARNADITVELTQSEIDKLGSNSLAFVFSTEAADNANKPSFTLEKPTTEFKTKDFISTLKIQNIGISSLNDVDYYYGVSDKDYTDGSVKANTKFAYELFDHVKTNADDPDDRGKRYKYAMYHVPITMNNSDDNDKFVYSNSSKKYYEIENAKPELFLNIFAVDKVEGKIQGIASLKLNNEEVNGDTVTTPLYDLLQYPCKIFAYITNGDQNTKGIMLGGSAVENECYSFNYIEYDAPYVIKTNQATSQSKAAISKSHYDNSSNTINIVSNRINLTKETINDDLYVNIQF